MPAFTSYAEAADVEEYVRGATAGLWGDVDNDLTASLVRAAREINERLAGLDRITVPVEEGEDGYAEVLIKLNVYVAVYNRVASTHAGEIFEDNWKWLRAMIADIYKKIEDGVFRFGTDDDEAISSGTRVFEIGRASP